MQNCSSLLGTASFQFSRQTGHAQHVASASKTQNAWGDAARATRATTRISASAGRRKRQGKAAPRTLSARPTPLALRGESVCVMTATSRRTGCVMSSLQQESLAGEGVGRFSVWLLSYECCSFQCMSVVCLWSFNMRV